MIAAADWLLVGGLMLLLSPMIVLWVCIAVHEIRGGYRDGAEW